MTYVTWDGDIVFTTAPTYGGVRGEYLVSDLKNDVSRKLHGTSLNKVEGVYDLVNESARQLLADIDPKKTIRIEQLSDPVLTYGIYRFEVPTDLKGDKIIDIRPLALRNSDDNWSKNSMERFNRFKSTGTFNVEYNSGGRYLCLPEETVNNLGTTIEMVYFSSFMFKDISGDNDVWKMNATSDDDAINLEIDSYNLLVYKMAELAADQIAGKDSTFDYTIYVQKYDKGLKKYKANYPSENIKPQFKYY